MDRTASVSARPLEDTVAAEERGSREWFAMWLALAWLTGLVLATPLYQPYPRLILPLLAITWIGSGIATVRLISGRIVNTGQLMSVARSAAGSDSSDSTPAPVVSRAADRSAVRRGWRFVWLAPIALLCGLLADHRQGRAWQDRRQLADIAARALADMRSASAESQQTVPGIRCVAYVYAEPGLLHHLTQDDVPVQPVMNLDFARPGARHPAIPTYLLAGPHAHRSEQFTEQFAAVRESLELVAMYPYRPSDFVLLDNFSPATLGHHRSSEVWLYRVVWK